MSEQADSVELPVPVSEGELVAPAPVGAIEQARRTTIPAVQAAAAAAGGFVAGAAVVGLVNRRHARALARGGARRGLLRRGRAAGRNAAVVDRSQIVGSRSFLLDVHLLGSPSPER
jgi:hypothetical protein